MIGKDIIYKVSPKIITKQSKATDIIMRTFDKNKLYLGFSVEDEDGVSLTPLNKYLNLTFEYVYTTLNEEGRVNYVHVPLNRSSCSYYNEVAKYSPDPVYMNSIYCVDNLNLTLGGSFDKLNNSYIFVQLKMCSNGTDTVCYPREKIVKATSGIYIVMITSEIEVSPKNYTNSIQIMQKIMYYFIGTSIEVEGITIIAGTVISKTR